MTQKTAETATATSTAYHGFHGFERQKQHEYGKRQGLLELQQENPLERAIWQISATLTDRFPQRFWQLQ